MTKKTGKLSIDKCAYCGRRDTGARYHKNYGESYCLPCLSRLRPVDGAPLYEPVAVRERRIVKTASGAVIRVEDGDE